MTVNWDAEPEIPFRYLVMHHSGTGTIRVQTNDEITPAEARKLAVALLNAAEKVEQEELVPA